MGASLVVAAVLLCASCTKKIGDDCKTSIDCSQESDRLCDISQPGGYCTVEGCDERSCPDGAICIRFFPRLFLTKKCSDGCTADELCLPDMFCAPRSLERRYCANSCGGDGDCRGGYVCRKAGSEGSLALTPDPAAIIHYCAPSGS
jgi:hypothetical protein